ncbi:hypothetical protein G8T71_06940 [Clostridium botulinum C/D]|uniref:hypothetical protein n=1 Tax=Clostridium botulinum TaxID=1491 RepID=UPI0004D5C5F3|nr:hypothetical protein [Clostridium botulinum]KEH96207.1 hypothetical protein Z953_p0275 [Clostridium botulinum D str. 16868]MCD3211090.1 hypothetical protein [Clostridium botulinum C/D]
MSIRISISFSERNIDDIKVYNYLQQKRSKSIFIKNLVQKHMEDEEKKFKNDGI